jgi:hypothetical protein
MRSFFVTAWLSLLKFAVPSDIQPLVVYNNPEPFTSDKYGSALSVYEDLVVIGAYSDDSTGAYTNSGTAYIYNTTSNEVQHKIINPNDGNGSGSFARSVSLYKDVVAMSSTNGYVNGTLYSCGFVYLYNATNATLIHMILNPDSVKTSTNARFGYGLSLYENILVAGAPDTNYFYFNNTDTILYGVGAVYFIDATTAVLLTKIFSPHPVEQGRFGYSVSMYKNKVVIGAYGENGWIGMAYIYDIDYENYVSNIGTIKYNNDRSKNDHNNLRTNLFKTFNLQTNFNIDTISFSSSNKNANNVISNNFNNNMYNNVNNNRHNHTQNNIRNDIQNNNNFMVTLFHTINNPIPYPADYFGWCVSIYKDIAIIGNFKSTQYNLKVYNGSAYIFNVTSGK